MLWLLFPALMAAAEPPQMTRSSEIVDVNVVEVDVVVLDQAGKPVTGLTREDFQLVVGKRKREISNFYAIDRQSVGATAAGGATAAETAAATPARRDFVVIFIDDHRLTQHEKKRALDGLRGFVAQHVRPGTAAMLVSSDSELRILQRFTEDASVLTRTIDELEEQPAHGEEYAIQRRQIMRMIEDFRATPDSRGDVAEVANQELETFVRREKLDAERTMEALDHVIHTVSGLDGRRVLVYVSDGLPMQPGAEIFAWYKPEEFLGTNEPQKQVLAQAQALDAMSVNLNAPLLRLARETAMAGVQFFAIDARGVRGFDEETPSSGRQTSTASTQLDSSLIRSNLKGPIQLLADETGGQAIIDQNDMNLAFADLDDHLSTYYSLGFRSDSSGREDDVQVKVRKRGLTVRAAKHARQRSTREQIADRVRASLYAHIEDNPLQAGVALAPLTGSQSGLKATITIPIVKLSIFPGQQGTDTSVAVFVAMMDANMRETPVRMFVHRVKPNGLNESVQSLTLNVEPGTYTVSLAVVDAYSWQASYVQREVTIAVR